MNLTDYKNDLEKFEKKLTVGAREQKLGFIILFKKIVQFGQKLSTNFITKKMVILLLKIRR